MIARTLRRRGAQTAAAILRPYAAVGPREERGDACGRRGAESNGHTRRAKISRACTGEEAARHPAVHIGISPGNAEAGEARLPEH